MIWWLLDRLDVCCSQDYITLRLIRYLTPLSARTYTLTSGHSLRHAHDADLLLSDTQSMLMPVYTIISGYSRIVQYAYVWRGNDSSSDRVISKIGTLALDAIYGLYSAFALPDMLDLEVAMSLTRMP